MYCFMCEGDLCYLLEIVPDHGPIFVLISGGVQAVAFIAVYCALSLHCITRHEYFDI